MVRNSTLAVLVLSSWAFWTDVAAGNTLTFAASSGILAARGNRSAALVYIALFVLMPRPVQLPLALVLLVRIPELRLPTAILLAAHTVAVFPQLEQWTTAMLDYSRTTQFDLGPRSVIGDIWIPVGLTLAVWAALRGRPGWAGLFVSPYWLPQYFLMPLLDRRVSGG
jgi:hypothetical protein